MMIEPACVDGRRLRRIMGRELWLPPDRRGDGWQMLARDGNAMIIVNSAPFEDGHDWIHASMSRRDDVPSYWDLAQLHSAVFGDEGWSLQVFAPADKHISIRAHVLHLWGRADGSRVHPNFGVHGTI
jgi:hypothetical protein